MSAPSPSLPPPCPVPQVIHSIIGDGCVIKAGSKVHGSVVGIRSLIGADCVVQVRHDEDVDTCGAQMYTRPGSLTAPQRSHSSRHPLRPDTVCHLTLFAPPWTRGTPNIVPSCPHLLLFPMLVHIHTHSAPDSQVFCIGHTYSHPMACILC